MTGALKRGDPQTHGRPCEEGGRDGSDAVKSLGMPGDSGSGGQRHGKAFPRHQTLPALPAL